MHSPFHSTLQATAKHLILTGIIFTVCNVLFPQNETLKTTFLCSCHRPLADVNFNAHHLLWGSGHNRDGQRHGESDLTV